MNKQFFVLLAASLLCLFCPKIQAQIITASQEEGCAPLVEVQFDSPADNTEVFWDFGDGTSSNLVSPVHTFVNAGSYTVIYTASDNGSPVEEELLIEVYGNPEVAIEASLTGGCVGDAVLFQDNSVVGGGVAIVEREWAFGDGGVDVGNNANPEHVFEITGSFDVTLKVTDANGCETTTSFPDLVTISAAPNVVYTTNPATAFACEPPLVVSFSAAGTTSNSPLGSELTYEWDFGDGSTADIATPSAHTYSEFGTYYTTLTVTDLNGCSMIVEDTVGIAEPFASFAVPDTVCAIVEFENLSSPGIAQWNYGDGSQGTSNIHEYQEPGNYDVSLLITAGPCQNDTTISIYVDTLEPEYTASPTYSCDVPVEIQYEDNTPGAVDWTWFLSTGDTLTGQNPVLSFDPGDDPYLLYKESFYVVDSLVVLSGSGCIDYRVDSLVMLWPITARTVPDIGQGCAPLTVFFADSSYSNEPIVSWEWDFDDGTTMVGDSDGVSHTFTEPGDYNVTLTISNDIGCEDVSYIVDIHVGEAPVPEFNLDPEGTICWDDTLNLIDDTPAVQMAENWHFDTDGGHSWHCPNNSSPQWGPWNTTGVQDITLEAEYNGCIGETTVEDVIEVEGPIGRIIYSCDCENPLEINFSAIIQQADTLSWDFGDGTILADTTLIDPVHVYEPGDYWVKLISRSSETECRPFRDSIYLQIRDIQAAWTADTLVCVGTPVLFDATESTGVDEFCKTGYQWYFDDGFAPQTTDQTTYTHFFGAPGPYDVRLVTRDVNFCADTLVQRIWVYDIRAQFEADPQFSCLPIDVQFTDFSTADTTIVSWEWDFGDGNTSTEQNPSHVYNSEPIDSFFVATLTVKDVLNCPSSSSVIIVPSIPDAAFTSEAIPAICENETLSFQAIEENESYLWDFGDGSTSSIQNPSHQYTEAGNYTVSLTVIDSVGCSETSTLNNFVSVQGYPEAAFSSSADTLEQLCYPLLINFSDESEGEPVSTWNWDLGNGNPVVSDPTVGTIYQNPGEVEVTLIAESANGCTDTTSQFYTIQGPTADITSFPAIICRGDEVTFDIVDSMDVWTYSWDFGDGTDTSNVSPITHTYDINPPSGQTTVSLVYYSPDSLCQATTTQSVFFRDLLADFNRNGESVVGDTMHCQGPADTFTNLSVNGDTFFWDFGDGTTYEGFQPPAHLYAEPGIYEITLFVDDEETGCSDEVTKVMHITDGAPLIALGDSGCEGDTLQLQAVGGINYTWAPAETLSDANISNPIAFPEETTVYTVTTVDEYGCRDTALVVAGIYTQPFDFVVDTFVVLGDSIALGTPGDPAFSQSWSPDTWLSCPECPFTYAAPEEDITYVSRLTDPGDCYTSEHRYNIEVRPVSSIDVPTAFTPNGDGINDFITVEGWGIIRVIEFNIYNRYGELVFEGREDNYAWDGYYKDELQNNETYVYTAIVQTFSGGSLTKNGTFHLLR